MFRIVAAVNGVLLEGWQEVFFQNRSISKNEIVACCDFVTHGLLEAGQEVFFQNRSISKNEIVACGHFVRHLAYLSRVA